MSDILRDYEAYENWIKEGQRLFGEDKKEIMSYFLYGINNFIYMNDAELRKLIFNRLKTFEYENIKQVSIYTITNLDKLISEIQQNLVTNSHFALYFLINSLAERICDGIIQNHKEPLDEKDKEHILLKIKDGRFSMHEKIIKIEKILKEKGGSEGQEFIGYLKLLHEIRNKFMFHFLDNDEYFSFYPKEREGEKDENLKEIFQIILGKIDYILSLINVMDEEKMVLEVYKKTIENVIKLLGEITYSPDSHTTTSNFYRSFSEYFTHISYAFILFLGRDNLKILN